MTESRTLFTLGHVVRTADALEALSDAKVPESSLLERHCSGDFGEVSTADRDSNLAAIENGGRVFSSYRITPYRTLWVITDADRTMTTVLTPAEYEQRFPPAYELRFRSLFNHGRGLSFPCDAAGRVDLDALSETARRNYFLARAAASLEYSAGAVVRVSRTRAA